MLARVYWPDLLDLSLPLASYNLFITMAMPTTRQSSEIDLQLAKDLQQYLSRGQRPPATTTYAPRGFVSKCHTF